jgi:P27 family predicted phage terminase small subunit
MGNRPTPSAIRQLTGVHLDRINRREACFRSVETAHPPKVVEANELAQEEWNRAVPELVENRLLNKANLMIFAHYCVAHSEALRFQGIVDQEGPWIDENVFNKKGDLTGSKRKANPFIKLARDARLEALRYATEFGMTPAASTKVAANPVDERKSSFADLMSTPIDDDDAESEAGAN